MEIYDRLGIADPAFSTSMAVDSVLEIQQFFIMSNTGNEALIEEGLPTLNEPVSGWVVAGCVNGTYDNQLTTCNMAISGTVCSINTKRYNTCVQPSV